PHQYTSCWLAGARAKLGLATADDGDETLVGDWLALVEEHAVDFTLAWRRLGYVAGRGGRPVAGPFAGRLGPPAALEGLVGGAPRAAGIALGRRAASRHAPRQPAVHCAQSPRRRSARRRIRAARPGALRAAARGRYPPIRRATRLGALRRTGAARGHSALQDI